MKTRAEHIAWCKERALEYVEAGDLPNALASMTSDLGKHHDTSSLVGFATVAGANYISQPAQMRKFIEDFN